VSSLLDLTFWLPLVFGLLLGFIFGVIVESYEIYISHREYFDKIVERKEWKSK